MTKYIYETAAETAKKIRKVLKAEFPATKFSVTSSTYSMGSSVSVRYKDGSEPDHDQVYKTVDRFSSKSFDGMTDMATMNGYEFDGQIFNGADYVMYSR